MSDKDKQIPNPRNLKYTKDHEWIRIEPDGTAFIGITDFAQSQLGDIVFLDVPKAGKTLKQFEKFGEVESVKSVSDLFTPVSCEVVDTNKHAIEQPELVNKEPFSNGWLLKVKVKDSSEVASLLSAQEYDGLTGK